MELYTSVMLLTLCCANTFSFPNGNVNQKRVYNFQKFRPISNIKRDHIFKEFNNVGNRIVDEYETSAMSRKLEVTLDALDRGLDYMWRHHNEVNLDGVIGTRIVQGQADLLLKTIETEHFTIPSDVTTRIYDMTQKAGEISDAAATFVQSDDPEYFNRIGGIIQDEFWTLDFPFRMTDQSLITKHLYDGESMREKDSDDCLTELLGTSATNTRCDISEHCWTLMTSPGYQAYSLSHEVFYLLIGQSAGCFYGDFVHVTDSLLQQFCADMLPETIHIATSHYPEWRKDLFMEQQALCGMSGFEDFLRAEWLDIILSWQMSDGCWGQHIHNNITAGENRPSNMRFKREERLLNDGCGSHRTAVSLSALIQYIKFITSYLYQNAA